jgi:hypothetical protein
MLTKEDVVKVLGPEISDRTIVDIIGTGANLQELALAGQWLASREEVLGKSGFPLTGAAARVYDILQTEEPGDDHDA